MRAGELAQRLTHEPRLQADVRIAHLALDLGLRHQRRHRVDHDDVHRTRAHQDLADLERLLAGVGLRDEQSSRRRRRACCAYSMSSACSASMKAATPPGALRIGDDVQAERRLAARFRSVDLGDAAARNAADADGRVEVDARRSESTRRVPSLIGAHPHDRALAAALLDLRDGQIQRLLLVVLPRGDSHDRSAHPVERELPNLACAIENRTVGGYLFATPEQTTKPLAD